MKTFLFIGILQAVVVFTAVYMLLTGVENEQSKYKANIGKSVIFGKDTLQTVDYSMLGSSYTLSNGVKVSVPYYQTLKIVKR